MKNTISKNRWRSGMTRPEFLLVTCILLIGIYAVVNSQKSGEILQIRWGKPAAKANLPADAIPPTKTRTNGIVTNAVSPIQIQEGVTISVSSTNVFRKTINHNIASPAFGMSSSTPQNHRIPVPTNAVWRVAPPRGGPGVRIAFP